MDGRIKKKNRLPVVLILETNELWGGEEEASHQSILEYLHIAAHTVLFYSLIDT